MHTEKDVNLIFLSYMIICFLSSIKSLVLFGPKGLLMPGSWIEVVTVYYLDSFVELFTTLIRFLTRFSLILTNGIVLSDAKARIFLSVQELPFQADTILL